MKAVFIGLGYIGLPTSAVAALYGVDVLGVDINENVVETINKGAIHIVEPGLEDVVKKVVAEGRFRASLVPEEADAFFIVVPTPFKENHEADLSYVNAAAISIVPFIRPGNLVILESTSPIYTTENLASLIFSLRPELKGCVYIAYCPERVLPGNVLHELIYNDRVIGGIDTASTEKAIDFYKLFVRGALHSTDSRTAEMCKLVENSSRDVQIAFANELSIVCNKAGIDVWKLIELANKHPRVNILSPGSGVGGHCIAVDPWFLVSQFPNETKLIKNARNVNDTKANWCIDEVITTIKHFELQNNRIPVVACMGLAFKPDIDDLRESPSLFITQSLFKKFGAKILFVEPNINSHQSSFELSSIENALEKADILVWLVKHSKFKGLNFYRDYIHFDFCGMKL